MAFDPSSATPYFDPDSAKPETASEPVKQYKIGKEGFADAMKQTLEEATPSQRFWGGSWGTLDNWAMRLKQALSSQGLSEEEQNRVIANRMVQDTPAGFAGGLSLDLAATAPALGFAQAKLAGALSPVAKTLAGTVGRVLGPTVAAGTVGAASGLATSPTLEGESNLEKAGWGAAGGMAGDVFARGAGRLAAPIQDLSDHAKFMIQKLGVKLTPGQAMGANSAIGRIEQMAESYPIIGQVIRAARGDATNDFVLSMINKAVPEGNPRATVIGRKGLEYVADKLDEGYRSVTAKVTSPISPDDVFKADIDRIKSEVSLDQSKKLINQFLKSKKWYGANGPEWKRIDSEIGREISDFINSPEGTQKQYARALIEIKGAWRDLLSRQAPEGVVPEIAALDKNWAAWLRVAKASGYTGAEDGVFNAEKFNRAVKEMSQKGPSGVKTRYSVGKEFLQPEADAAYATLRDTVGNSYSFDRWALGASLGAAGGLTSLAEWYGTPSYVTALAATPLLMSPAGRRYMVSGYPWQPALGQGLRQAAPYASQVTRALATQKE